MIKFDNVFFKYNNSKNMTLADISSKYDVSANELVNMILDNGVHNSGPRTFQEGPAFVVKDDTTSNTEVQEQDRLQEASGLPR